MGKIREYGGKMGLKGVEDESEVKISNTLYESLKELTKEINKRKECVFEPSHRAGWCVNRGGAFLLFQPLSPK